MDVMVIVPSPNCQPGRLTKMCTSWLALRQAVTVAEDSVLSIRNWLFEISEDTPDSVHVLRGGRSHQS